MQNIALATLGLIENPKTSPSSENSILMQSNNGMFYLSLCNGLAALWKVSFTKRLNVEAKFSTFES